MKFLINQKKLLPVLGMACLMPFYMQTAQASSTINSFANLKYTINNISVLSGSGDQSGLEITDVFELAPSESEPIYGSGTITVVPDNSSPFNKQFTLLSEIRDGAITYSENAWLGLSFLNTTSDTSYDVQVTLDYSLSADSNANVETVNDSAYTEVWLNYFNSDASFSGAAFTTSWSNPTEQLGNLQASGSSGIFRFTLDPDDVEILFADVKIAGNLNASVTPVPVPGAIWLFASALLALPGLNRIKSRAWFYFVRLHDHYFPSSSFRHGLPESRLHGWI